MTSAQAVQLAKAVTHDGLDQLLDVGTRLAALVPEHDANIESALRRWRELIKRAPSVLGVVTEDAQLVETMIASRPVSFARGSLSPELFKLLDPADASIALWREIDEMAHHARAATAALARATLRTSLEYMSPSISCGVHLRQLIEIAFWASTYQYGLTTAWNVMMRQSKSEAPCLWCSSDIDNYVRGAYSSIRAGRLRAALSLDPTTEDSMDPSVDEFDPLMIKQREVGLHIARAIDDDTGGSRIKLHAERLERLYGILSAFVHVTPWSLGSELPFPNGPEPSQLDQDSLIVATAISSTIVLWELSLHHRFDRVRFLPLIYQHGNLGRRRAKPYRMANFQVPELVDLSTKGKKLEFTIGSDKHRVYPRPKNSGQP